MGVLRNERFSRSSRSLPGRGGSGNHSIGSAIPSVAREVQRQGNAGFMRYFIGAISEVAVINKPLDKEKITATWEAIKQL